MTLTVEQMSSIQAMAMAPLSDFNRWFELSGLPESNRDEAEEYWDDMEQAYVNLPPGHSLDVASDW